MVVPLLYHHLCGKSKATAACALLRWLHDREGSHKQYGHQGGCGQAIHLRLLSCEVGIQQRARLTTQVLRVSCSTSVVLVHGVRGTSGSSQGRWGGCWWIQFDWSIDIGVQLVVVEREEGRELAYLHSVSVMSKTRRTVVDLSLKTQCCVSLVSTHKEARWSIRFFSLFTVDDEGYVQPTNKQNWTLNSNEDKEPCIATIYIYIQTEERSGNETTRMFLNS